MAVLSENVKIFIVQQLAMWRGPTQVATAVKEEFGVDVLRQGVWAYRRENPQLAKRWQVLFDETRRKFLETISDIPIANQAYRVQELQDSLDRQKRLKKINESMVQNILEQAAKEIGGMFTNQRQITGANGRPLFDTVEVAQAVLNDLIAKEGWRQPDALKWVAERYSLAEAVLVSDASN